MASMERKRQSSSEAESFDDISGLQISSISGLIDGNRYDHYTSEYDTDALIIRRGRTFLLRIDVKHPYQDSNYFYLELKTGNRPSRKSGTLIKILQFSGKEGKDDWYFKISTQEDSHLVLLVNVPAHVLISRYLLTVVTQFTQNNKKQINEYVYSKDLFILFNPWCEDDEVYMENDNFRQEYVLNDFGCVYWGGVRAKPWFFGQFTDAALKCTFNLLEKVHARRRDTAREVVRHMSAMANSFDNNGLLTGNWSGDYSGGVKPWEWNGSVRIFKKYLETGSSVEYGQCWVFSGLITSMMRALGIPARSVTNYDSAHDADDNATFDKFFDEEMNYLEDESDDSCWNFHVWNDVWITRPDLPSGMGGWQAIDGTPQEESKGIYRCGPASLQAIREGNVHLNYDTRFIFAEVNADEVYWQVQKDEVGNEEYKPIRVKTRKVGHDMSTKSPYGRYREDVTDQYKYPEGSVLERGAINNALKRSKNPIVADQANDVKFSSKLPFDVSCDSGVDFIVRANNTSDKDLTVEIVVTGQVVRYTGVTLAKLQQKRLSKKVEASKDVEFSLHYDSNEYSKLFDENITLRFSYMASVKETKQIYVSQKTCAITKPTLSTELVDRKDNIVKPGDEVKVKVTVPSVCNISKFTNCTLELDGSVLADEDIIHKVGDLKADGTSYIIKSFVVKKTIQKSRTLELIATFNSKELTGIDGTLEFEVRV